ncbi:MAG: hypothetical protein JNJ59_23310 [Deltaproteobacteria bacterium]|nr:hypothetical protein [Deltaproteobacteria bacterium]
MSIEPTSSAAGPFGSPATFGAWLLAVRWIAALSLSVVALVTTAIDPRLAPTATRQLWIVIGLLIAFDLTLTLRGPAATASRRSITLQVLVDTSLLAMALHTAGGVLNPFASFFVFHAIMAGLFASPRTCARLILFVAFVALSLGVLEASGLAPADCLRLDRAQCTSPDPLAILAAGVGIVALTLGCGFLVATLTRSFQRERDSLARTSLERGREARELVLAKSSLAVEQGKLHAVVNCIADAVLFAAPDGRILLRNRAAGALWPGREEGPADDLRVCHTESRWAHMLDKLIHAADLEHHPLLPIGGRTYEATYGRVIGPDGATLGAVMVARDVTERLKEQALRAERERMVTIGKLAAALAHEINNPLGSIQLYTQHALKQLDGKEPLSEHLGTVLRNANVCKKIVRDLLEYARQRPPETRSIAPAELIALAVKTIRPQADRAHVQVEIAPAPEGLGALVVDPDQVVQVLVNFALNGIDALGDPTPDRPRVLSFAIEAHATELAFVVADSGPGIPESARAQIFAPFFTTKAEGTGLGLAVARDLASAHGGRVALLETSGAGTRLALILPRVSTPPVAPAGEVRA